MQLQHQKITLDVNDTRAFTVLNAHQGDSKTRFIDITLTENGNTITLSSNYVATIKASINNKTKAVNTAVIDATNNVVTVELTKTMLDTPGLLNCEVILQDNQQFVTSATFTVKVAESVISDESEIVASQEFGKLLDALIEIKDIEDKADRVQTLVDNIDKLKSADDIINRLSTSETNIETNKVSIKELSELVQEVKNSAIAEIESLKSGKLDKTDLPTAILSDTPSTVTTYSSEKIDNLLSKKAEKSAVDNNKFDLSMLMSSLKRTATGTNIVNITNTAENGILKVTSDSGVTCKNKNIFEDILTDNIKKTNCNVSYDDITGAYTVEYTGDGTNSFSFGNIRGNGSIYDVNCGKKLKYHKNLSVRFNCEKTVNSGCCITFYDSNGIVIGTINKGTNTTFKINDVEDAEFITMKIGFDSNGGILSTGDIIHFSVQLEYGNTVSDYVVPQINTKNLSYEGVTNIVGDGEITVEYVPAEKNIISVDLPIYNGGVVE